MANSCDIELRVVSQPRYLAVVRATVEAAAQRLGLGEPMAGQVALAVDEAVSNVIGHGYGGQQDRPIWVKISPRQVTGVDAIEIILEDECQGVDLTRIRSRPIEEVRPGGLGVHIIRQVMDEVEYRHRPDGAGVWLRMLKLIKPAEAGQKG